MQFKWHDGLLFFKKILYVPDGSSCFQVIQNCQDTYTIRHFGINKTLDLLTQSFWWPHLHNFAKDYVHTRDTCCRAMIPQHHLYGLLQPYQFQEGHGNLRL